MEVLLLQLHIVTDNKCHFHNYINQGFWYFKGFIIYPFYLFFRKQPVSDREEQQVQTAHLVHSTVVNTDQSETFCCLFLSAINLHLNTTFMRKNPKTVKCKERKKNEHNRNKWINYHTQKLELEDIFHLCALTASEQRKLLLSVQLLIHSLASVSSEIINKCQCASSSNSLTYSSHNKSTTVFGRREGALGEELFLFFFFFPLFWKDLIFISSVHRTLCRFCL